MSKTVTRRDRLAFHHEEKVLRERRLSGILRPNLDHRHPVIVPTYPSTETLEEQAKRFAANHQPWYLTNIRLPAWDRSTPRLKAPYCSLALSLAGSAYTVTLRLGAERIRRGASSSQKLMQHLRREIARKLNAALGRSVEFWFVLELSNDVKEHLHGELGIDVSELKEAKRVLRGVALDYYPPRAVHAKLTYAPLGAGGYASKEVDFTRLVRPGAPFTRTEALQRRASDLYRLHCLVHIECLRARAEASSKPIRERLRAA